MESDEENDVAILRDAAAVSRYLESLKTRLQHVLTATAVNVVRVSEWLAGTLLAKTRKSTFI